MIEDFRIKMIERCKMKNLDLLYHFLGFTLYIKKPHVYYVNFFNILNLILHFIVNYYIVYGDTTTNFNFNEVYYLGV